MHAFTAVTTFDNYDISIVLNELTKEIQLNWSMEINVLLNIVSQISSRYILRNNIDKWIDHEWY